MSSKYKIVNRDGVYFITATIVDWVTFFTRKDYRDILMDSFSFCQQNQGLSINDQSFSSNLFNNR